MNTKILSLVSTIIIVFMIMSNMNISYASDIGDIFTGANNFIDAGGENGVNKDDLQPVSDMIYKILVVLGIGIAVIISTILGIKFMIGSVEEKAQVKDALIPFLIGCVVIFGAFSIWRIVVNVGNSMEGNYPTTTFTRTEDGKYYCDSCKDELEILEQRRNKCSQCGSHIQGI